jgi:hypothetical protein
MARMPFSGERILETVEAKNETQRAFLALLVTFYCIVEKGLTFNLARWNGML